MTVNNNGVFVISDDWGGSGILEIMPEDFNYEETEERAYYHIGRLGRGVFIYLIFPDTERDCKFMGQVMPPSNKCADKSLD